ncbi:MAG TPA: hypothetical protein VF457_02390, partial [Burkholderiaceae bacterium]
MPAPTLRPAADPLDDIDREAPVDSAMARQERADLPGERSDRPRQARGGGDVYLDAARELAREERDPEQARRDDDRDAERVEDGDPDIAYGADLLAPGEHGRGADDDDPIDETE